MEVVGRDEYGSADELLVSERTVFEYEYEESSRRGVVVVDSVE